jgi:hypothetical protein
MSGFQLVKRHSEPRHFKTDPICSLKYQTAIRIFILRPDNRGYMTRLKPSDGDSSRERGMRHHLLVHGVNFFYLRDKPHPYLAKGLTLIASRYKPPFDNLDLRQAMALSLDRKAFIDILSEGQGDIGGVMQPIPGGLWGMPPDLLKELPGYGPDVQKNRAQARQIMEKLGYGPDRKLKVTVTTRDLPVFPDPAVILIDQLKEVHIDGELETVDTTAYFPKSSARISPSVSTSRPVAPTPIRSSSSFMDAVRT